MPGSPGSTAGSTDLEALKAKYDAIVEYTVHLTAERDMIVTQLEVMKKEYNNELKQGKKGDKKGGEASVGEKGKDAEMKVVQVGALHCCVHCCVLLCCVSHRIALLYTVPYHSIITFHSALLFIGLFVDGDSAGGCYRLCLGQVCSAYLSNSLWVAVRSLGVSLHVVTITIIHLFLINDIHCHLQEN
jgi:hypothetical protein